MNTPVRIAIVDPYERVRDSLKIVLQDCPDLLFVGETCFAQQMVSLCGLVKPDVVLFDFGSKANDIGVIEELRNLYPQVKVLVLTANMEYKYAKNAIRAGANGYIYKMVNTAELQEAIVMVNNFQRVVDKEIQSALTN